MENPTDEDKRIILDGSNALFLDLCTTMKDYIKVPKNNKLDAWYKQQILLDATANALIFVIESCATDQGKFELASRLCKGIIGRIAQGYPVEQNSFVN
jgi:hypothetical protein